MLSMGSIRSAVEQAAALYPVKRVELFGSYADGSAQEHSDADFLVEFSESPISLFKLCGFQETLSELLRMDVDIVELPLQANSDLKVGRTVHIYGS